MACKIHGLVKVVFVHQDGKVTGSAFSLLNMIKGFLDQVEAHVILGEKGPLEQLLATNKIAYTIYPFIRFWTAPGPRLHYRSARKQLKALLPDKKLANHILSLKPDIIHLNDKACLQAGVSMKNYGIPIIQQSRSTYYTTNSTLLKILSLNSITRYASKIIAISEDESDGFKDKHGLSIIFNTIDLQATDQAISKRQKKRIELGIEENEIVIGFAANITRIKGAWDFLDMVEKLLQRYPENNLRFIMAGRLPSGQKQKGILERLGLRKPEHPENKMKEYLSKPILEGRVNVLGFRTDILEIIAAMDILVVCTRLGVLGRQPFEAMALRTPVVVTSGHSGKSRVILHEKTGLVVPMKNLDALTNNVGRLIEDPALRIRLAENGYNYAHQEFNPAINSRKILDIYQHLTQLPLSNQPNYAGES